MLSSCLRPLVPAVALLALHGAVPAWADPSLENEVVTGSVVVLPADRIIDRDYVAIAERVDIAGTVNGDVHVFARQVKLSGTVNGDLLASGATVEIIGTVSQNARVVAGRVSMSGTIGRNLSIASWDAALDPRGTVEGALFAAGKTVRVDASVGRTVTVAGDTVTLGGSVGGYVNAAARALEVASTAKIAGHVSYLGQNPPQIHPDAQIGGPVNRRDIPTIQIPWADQLDQVWQWLGVGLLLTSALSTLVLGVVIVGLFPRSVERTMEQLSGNLLQSGGIGLLLCILTPVLIVMLLLSLFGLPIALVLLGVLAVMLYVARIFTMTWVGRGIQTQLGWSRPTTPAFIIGLVIYYALRLIPVFGPVVGVVATLVGLGAVARAAVAGDHGSPLETPRHRRFAAREFE
ncbi:hypothetical protein YTPLAS18_29800 [Nitrospira sp.]|nr:hypothetical protein YTPLAS18_29800 [Nitrospira sp.]